MSEQSLETLLVVGHLIEGTLIVLDIGGVLFDHLGQEHWVNHEHIERAKQQGEYEPLAVQENWLSRLHKNPLLANRRLVPIES